MVLPGMASAGGAKLEGRDWDIALGQDLGARAPTQKRDGPRPLALRAQRSCSRAFKLVKVLARVPMRGRTPGKAALRASRLSFGRDILGPGTESGGGQCCGGRRQYRVRGSAVAALKAEEARRRIITLLEERPITTAAVAASSGPARCGFSVTRSMRRGAATAA